MLQFLGLPGFWCVVGAAVRLLLFGVVMVLLLFLSFSCLAGVSRSLLLSVLSLVMVVLMMLQMFFMSAKM